MRRNARCSVRDSRTSARRRRRWLVRLARDPPVGIAVERQRAPDRHVLLLADRRGARSRGVGRRSQRRVRLGRQRRGQHPALIEEHDLAARQHLDAVGEAPAQADAGAQRAEDLGLEHDRHRHHLQQLVAARPERDVIGAAERLANALAAADLAAAGGPARRRSPSGTPSRLVTTSRSASSIAWYSAASGGRSARAARTPPP